MPMNGIDRWVWLSIRPGSTKHPPASITDAPSGASTLPRAAIVSPSINTSPANSPSAVTIVPLAINVVSVIAPLLLAPLSSIWDPHVLRADLQDLPEAPNEIVEDLGIADQRRRDLHDRVAAVI